MTKNRAITVNIAGLVHSFMLSVDNDPLWLPIVTSTTRRCYDDYVNANDELYCGEIPKYLYDIVDCTYIENFLRCPLFNPKKLEQCRLTLEYVDKCLRLGTAGELIDVI